MTWMYHRSIRMLGILAATCGLAACEASDVGDEELLAEELLDTELRSQGLGLIVLEAEADTVVRTDYNIIRNDNWGCAPFFMVGTGRGGNMQPYGAADAMRSLLRFDLDEVDVRQVKRATLEISLSDLGLHPGTTPFTINAHRVIQSGERTPWVEGNGYIGSGPMPSGCQNVDAAFGVAWWGGPDPLNSQGATLGLNNESQPDFDPQVLGTITIDPLSSAPGDVFKMDLTGVVNAWLSGQVHNEGLVLRDPTTEWEFREIYLGSREGEAAGGVRGPRLVLDKRPKVEITAVDSKATLRWSPQPNATYSIFRSTNPDFTFTDPGTTLIATGLTHGEYTDDFSIDVFDPAHPADPYDLGAFYQVVENTFGSDNPSVVVGRIPIAVRYDNLSQPLLYHYSKIPLCLAPEPTDARRQMLLNEELTSVHWWEPALQRYAIDVEPFYSVGTRALGEVLAVRTSPSAQAGLRRFQLTGEVPEECELVAGLYEGTNVLTWPVTAEPMKASDLLALVPGAISVGHWRLLQQEVAWHPAVPPQGIPGVSSQASPVDFEIEPCSDVYLYVDKSSAPNGTPVDIMWPPGIAACEE